MHANKQQETFTLSVGATCISGAVGMPWAFRSIERPRKHCKTMLHIRFCTTPNLYLMRGDVERVARLTNRTTHDVRKVLRDRDGYFPYEEYEDIVDALSIVMHANQIFYHSLRMAWLPREPNMTYEQMISVLDRSDYKIIAESLGIKSRQIYEDLCPELYKEGLGNEIVYASRLRAESQLYIQRQYEALYGEKQSNSPNEPEA